jgi:DNA-binding NtrC family response regulator
MPSLDQPASYLGMSAVIHSRAMRSVIAQVQRVAPTSATVLILGESGAGKEIVARAIHHYSLRSSRPWVDVSCAALPEHLIESELFGHEKGAFSGADVAKPGLFELAHTGTLLLDEIGELDARMQVKLLRVLDGAPYYRLGGVRKVRSDARIVAATNQDLAAAVAAGSFRADLYHRLSQIVIEVPPLRRRREDVLPLAEFFLAAERPDLGLAQETRAALLAHPWPGNVRELRNVIMKAALFADGPEIRVENLPPEFSLPRPEAPGAGRSLEGMEKQMIFETLEQTSGHHERAAALLGISRRTLSRKLKLYREAVTQPLTQ